MTAEVIVVDNDDTGNESADTIAVEAAVTSAVAANDAQHATADAQEAATDAIIAAEVAEGALQVAEESAASSADSAARAEISLAGIATMLESLPERIKESLQATELEAGTEESADNPYAESDDTPEEAPPQRQGWLAKHFSRSYDGR